MEATMEMPATEQAVNEQAAEQTTAPVDNAQSAEANAAPEATVAEATVEQPIEATSAAVTAPEPTPEEKNAKRIIDLQAKIALQKSEVADRAVAVEEAKETAKSLAKSLDSAVEYLRELQSNLSMAENWTPAADPAPLFDNPELRSAPAEESPADESWRSLTLEQIGIKSPRVLAALQEHEPRIGTFGELADWQNAKGEFWAKDIKGLGDVGREEIENAQLAYWTAHPQPEKAEVAEQPATEPEGPSASGATSTVAETPQQTDPAAHVGSNGDGKAT